MALRSSSCVLTGTMLPPARVRLARQIPEGRHLRAGAERLRVFEPLGYPLLAELQAHVLQVRPDLLLILHQVARLRVELVDRASSWLLLTTQTLGAREELLRRARPRRRGRAVGARDLRVALVGGDFVFELLDRAGARSRARPSRGRSPRSGGSRRSRARRRGLCPWLSVRRALQHAVVRVALVAAGLHVLLREERVQPVAVPAVPLLDRRWWRARCPSGSSRSRTSPGRES